MANERLALSAFVVPLLGRFLETWRLLPQATYLFIYFLLIYLFIYLFISFGHTKYIQIYDKQIVKQNKEPRRTDTVLSNYVGFPLKMILLLGADLSAMPKKNHLCILYILINISNEPYY